jgi:hypothetical protein
MVISVTTSSTSMQSLMSAAQLQELGNQQTVEGIYSFVLYNASTNIIYIERFDTTATSSTSLPIAAGTSLSITSRNLNINLIAATGASSLIIG